MSVSTVRVGVRIRPFVAKEKGQNDIIEAHDKQSLLFKGQTFTYDHVFPASVSQSDLYSNTAGPMLKSFLEGYNCTIIAYGQTGSGKTFSMGTSDLQNHDSSTLGLVPRFVNDLFENLNHPDDQNTGTTFKIKASFLEIYGEDVYDLLAGTRGQDRSSLPVREDEHGKVFVQGQVEHDVHDAESALESLAVGSTNRITAATAMNVGSSRSHAVYTLTLEQRIKSNDGEDNEGTHLLSSKLTFVDLAGSERIKRTGAEGQRMKEGIQINSGLFNLGQVINSLADEQRLLKNSNKASFVPYRNSKLTHLLKDALGGNSQTLFLACVSPAESNESETYSTLSYARQARNIQNKPVQNVDETQVELRRLKYGLRTWMLQAVKLMFAPPSTSPHSTDDSIPTSASKATVFSPQAATLLSTMKSNSNIGEDEAQLLQRPEVLAFIESVNASIKEKSTFGASPSPRKVRLSVGAPAFRGLTSPTGAARGSPRALLNTGSKSVNRMSIFRRAPPPAEITADTSFFPEDDGEDDDQGRGGFHGGRESILFSADLSSALEAATKVDDSEQLIEKMLDMVSQEKKLLAIPSTASNAAEDNTDNNSMTTANANANDEQEAEQLATVDKLIQEKEEILTKLLDNIKGYATLKAEFEKLVDAISGLEDEKNHLEEELEKARKSNQSSTGLDKIKERFAVVKEELRRMKEDRKTKEQAYRLMQKESKQCDSMQKEVQKLKESRVALLKQQKSQAQELQRLKKEQTTKLQGIQRADIKKQQQMNAIKSELMKKERIIGHKEREVSRISMKLKACEDHITQLLKIQQRQRQAGATSNSTKGCAAASAANASSNLPASGKASAAASNKLDAIESEHLTTSKAVLEQAVLTQVDRHAMRYLYTKKTSMLKELNHEMVAEAKELEEMLVNKAALRAQLAIDEESTELTCELAAIENDIELVELKLQQRTRVIDMLNADIDELSLQLDDAAQQQAVTSESSTAAAAAEQVWTQIGRDIITGLSTSQAHQLLLELTTEKITLCKKLRTLDADLTTSQMQYNQAIDLGNALDEQLQRAQELHRKQLINVEKKRVDDIWSIMQATNKESSAVGEPQQERGLQHDIAVKQANLLQKQLHEVQEQVENTRIDAEMQQVVISSQLNTIHDLKLRIQIQSSNNNSGGGVEEKQQVDEECMNKLRLLWQEIGNSFEERESVLQFIMKSHAMAKERAIYEAEMNLKTLEQEFNQTKSIYDAYSYALGNDSTPTIDYAKLGKVQAIDKLKGLIDSACEKVKAVLPKVLTMQEQLQHNMNEMWMTTSDLSPSLQAFQAISACVNDIQALVQNCCAHKVTLQQEQVEAWYDEIKALHLQRVQTTSALITIRDQCIALCDDLQLTKNDDLQVLLDSIFTQDEEITPRGIAAVIQILVKQSTSNPPGSMMLLSTFEKVKLLLESVRLSRVTLSTNLVKVLTAVHAQLQTEAHVRFEVVVGKEQLENQLQTCLNLPVKLREEQENHTQEASHLLSLLNGIDLTSAVNEVQASITRNTSSSPLASIATIYDVHEELTGLELFIEESWLQTILSYLTKLLHASNSGSCKQLLQQISYLQIEQSRLEEVIDIQQELVKCDKALVKHIVDLEEFELASKADRVKALSGNSKMLIEEEKYRKNGKRKYEQITEKMLQLYQKLLATTTSSSTSAMYENMLEVKIDLNVLSGQGQLLLRGGVSKEKVELMRLHTSAAASVVPMTSSLPPAPPALAVVESAGEKANAPGTANVATASRRTSLDKAGSSNNSSRSALFKKDMSSNPSSKQLIKIKSESNVMTGASIKPATKVAKVVSKPLVPGQPSTVLMPLMSAGGDGPSTAPRNNRRLSFHPPTPPAAGDEDVEAVLSAEEDKSGSNEESRRESGESSSSGSSNDENVLLECDNVFGELIR